MDCDCAKVGAGPAGLHCATYLGRFKRTTIVFHGGKSRAEWIPTTYNFPGFPKGIAGLDLLRTLRRQCRLYGAEIIRDCVTSIEGSDGAFVVRTPELEIRAGKIVLATGVQDMPVDIPNYNHFKGRTIRHCPICDAYEAGGRKLAVFGSGEHAVKMTLWLSHYTRDLALLTNGDYLAEDLRSRLGSDGIGIIEHKISRIEENHRELGTIIFDDGSSIGGIFRGYSAMGLKPNSEIATAMGTEVDQNGYIVADREFQCTNRKGVYAIGDIVSGELGQLSVAVGHAATAATSIHNSLLAI